MNAKDVFLIVLSHAGGSLKGKTLVQKKGFFLDHFLDLGLAYRSHFYGPYSPELDSAIGQCKALGFVEERVAEYGVVSQDKFEVKRFDYRLTEDGRIVAQAIRKREPELCSKIESCLERLERAGNLDYVQLSIAAKSVHILKTSDKSMRPSDIAGEARKFGWNISEQAVDRAVDFLKELDLVMAESR